MSEFAQFQPRDGDCVLHCGHLDREGPFHWSLIPDSLHFLRPDGSTGSAKWMACCADCFKRIDGDFHKLDVRGDGLWMGDAPTIKVPRAAS